MYAYLRYSSIFVKLVNCCDRCEHRVFEDVESKRRGFKIRELFTILCSASYPLSVDAGSTFERNRAKAHSESGGVALENAGKASPRRH